MNVPNTNKPFLLTLIGVVLLGIPLALYALQHQEIFQENAWSTQQSAVSQCSAQEGSAVIIVTFANTESDKDMNVTVNDLQTGQFANLGTVKLMNSKSADIVTGKSSLTAGSVIFHLSWTDGTAGTDQLGATYQAINNCPVQTPSANFCPDTPSNNQGTCSWSPLAGAQGYNVVVKETDTGQIIQSISVDKNATQSDFPMTPGKPYVCTVSPTSECGTGTPVTSTEKICTPPTPTPSPTPPVCSNNTPQGICRWDASPNATSYNITVKDLTSGKTIITNTVQAPTTHYAFNDNGIDTYECDVTANNLCGNSLPAKSPPSTCTSPTPTQPGVTVSPTPVVTATPTPTALPTPTSLPTATPAPTVTPIPTATPRPRPTPTPVVIVRILTPPQQQVVVTSPPQQTVVRVPGQTNTVVQQSPPQTVVVTQPPNQPTARPFSPVTPVPTVMATGNTTPTVIAIGTSALLLLAGGIIFFLL